MTTAADFLPAILAAPDDDTPRLVLADWLEENGEPARAEFIRVGCELARLESLGLHDSAACNVTGQCARCARDVKAEPLRLRERELLHFNEGRWLDWLKAAWGSEWVPDRECGLTWRRGFVDEVRCVLADWLLHGPAIVRAQPVTKVAAADLFLGPLDMWNGVREERAWVGPLEDDEPWPVYSDAAVARSATSAFLISWAKLDDPPRSAAINVIARRAADFLRWGRYHAPHP